MPDDSDPPDSGLRRDLLNQLQSLSTSLDGAPLGAEADIPMLMDIVDLPKVSSPAPSQPTAALEPVAAADVIAEAESARIIEELIQEFLPRIETRLRERLESHFREHGGTGNRD